MSKRDLFIRNCRVLQEEIAHAIEDLRFREEGGRLLYAVDHAEVRAFVLPNMGSDREQFLLFSQEADDRNRANILQQYILKQLFSGSFGDLVQLIPYVRELKFFVENLKRVNVYQQINAALRVGDEVAEALNQEDLIQLLNDIDRDGMRSDLQSNYGHSLIKFVEENTPSLLLLNNPPKRTALGRLRSLYSHEEALTDLTALVESGELAESDLEGDEEIYNRWYEKLRAYAKRRDRGSPESDLRDAKAISYLYQANSKLQSGKTKVLLVTRSSRMRELLNEELRMGLWSKAGGDILRHPRVFNLLFVENPTALSKARRLLEEQAHEIHSFLQTATSLSIQTQIQTQNRDHTQDDSFLDEGAQKIWEIWWSTRGLEMAIHESAHLEQTEQDDSRASRILQLLRDERRLRALALERLDALKAEIGQDFRFLDSVMQGIKEEETISINRLLSTQMVERNGRQLLTLDTDHRAYSLYFFTAEAQARLRALDLHDDYRWEALIELVKSNFEGEAVKNEVAHEGLLSMAFIQGALGHWDNAEAYCQKALEKNGESSEAYYFLAICTRQWKRSVQRHLLALRYLQKATEYTLHHFDDPAYTDARFLKERGANILMMHLYPPVSSNGPADREEVEKYSVETGLELLEEAYRLSADNPDLQGVILNNRLIFYLLSARKEYRPLIDQETEALERLYRNRKPIPVFVTRVLTLVDAALHGSKTLVAGAENFMI